MEDQSKDIMNEMDQTRTSMTEKLEALETRVTEKVQPVVDAVGRVSEAAASIVENVKESVHNVSDTVQNVTESIQGVSQQVGETVKSVATAFSLRRQTEQHPWLVFGIAAATGCMVGTFLGRRGRRKSAPPDRQEARSDRNGTNGASYRAEALRERRTLSGDESKKESWYAEPLNTLKGLAISTLMSAVRDIAKLAVPGAVGDQIAKEVEGLTTKMGATPIPGSVFGDDTEKKADDQDDTSVRAKSAGAKISAGQTTEPFNRITARKNGPGIL